MRAGLKHTCVTILVAALTLIAVVCLAPLLTGTDPGAEPVHLDGSPENEPIYGAAKMSNGEIEAYRQQIGACATPGERARFRAQHRQRIQNRFNNRYGTGEPSSVEGELPGGPGSGGINVTTPRQGSGRGGRGAGGGKRGGS